MSAGLFFLGGMLGRVAGPIAQDWFTYNTKMGRELSRQKELTEERKKRLEYDFRIKLSDREHQNKLVDLEKQFQDSRKRAEEQMYLNREDWYQKEFWAKCFPLRNPFEMPLGFEPEFEESSRRLKGCRLQTINIANHKEIIPLRVITALTNAINPSAATLNSELSMFLVNNYSVAGNNAVFSDIGSWKEDAPINDASVNYLFKGLQGQPTMVIVPIFTNGGTTVRLKVWSWGLGEQQNKLPLQYPIGFDFGWFSLDAIKKKVLYDEIINFQNILENTGIQLPPDKERDYNNKLVSLIKEKREILSDEDFSSILSPLTIPAHIKLAVERKTNEIASTHLSCLAGMYADGYHLSTYGTMPILPSLLDRMPGIEYILPSVCDYYRSLVNAKLIERVLTTEQAAEIELQLAKAISNTNLSPAIIGPVISDLRLLNYTLDGSRHQEIVSEIRRINNNLKLLNNE